MNGELEDEKDCATLQYSNTIIKTQKLPFKTHNNPLHVSTPMLQ